MVLNEKHWFVVVSFKTELLSEYIIQNGYKHMDKILGIGFSFRNRKNVDNDICGVREEYAHFQELIKKDYRKLLPHFFKVIEEASKEFIVLGEKVQNQNLKDISDSELTKLFS